MISINVVILPSNFLFMKNTDISFLGTFLSEVFVERTEEGKTNPLLNIKPVTDNLLDFPKIEEEIIPTLSLPQHKNFIDEKYFFTDSNPFIKKSNPEYVFAEDKLPQSENRLIKGEASTRTLLTKLSFPIYFRDLKDLEGIFEIEVEFLVTPGGEVYLPKILHSSGSFEIDRLATNYIRHLKFNPLSLNQKQKDQRGTIKITISSNK